MDISITHGGVSSDCISFETNDLYSHLQRGLMKEGLVLFGDNAYLNSSFLAMPYPNAMSGSYDDYKYYHLQLSVMCFCGILLQ